MTDSRADGGSSMDEHPPSFEDEFGEDYEAPGWPPWVRVLALVMALLVAFFLVATSVGGLSVLFG